MPISTSRRALFKTAEINERHDTEQGNGITPARNDANKCIEIVSIHVACQAVHRLIGLVLHQPLAPQFTFLVFVHGLYDFHSEW